MNPYEIRVESLRFALASGKDRHYREYIESARAFEQFINGKDGGKGGVTKRVSVKPGDCVYIEGGD